MTLRFLHRYLGSRKEQEAFIEGEQYCFRFNNKAKSLSVSANRKKGIENEEFANALLIGILKDCKKGVEIRGRHILI